MILKFCKKSCCVHSKALEYSSSTYNTDTASLTRETAKNGKQADR